MSAQFSGPTQPTGTARTGGETLPIWVMPLASRQPDYRTSDRLQTPLEQRAVVEPQQPLGDVDAPISIDPDQMVVEGGVVDLQQGDAVRHHRLAQ